MIANRETSDHYHWGGACDGWVLRPGEDLLIIEERMPANTQEERHVHAKAEQFFYVRTGTLTMELDGTIFQVHERSGIAVAKGTPHQARNDTEWDVTFLVISSPTSRGDREAATSSRSPHVR